MGEKGEQILESFKLKETDKSDYKVVLNKFALYVVPKKNLFFERLGCLNVNKGQQKLKKVLLILFIILRKTVNGGRLKIK
jgi:hypothetical protein